MVDPHATVGAKYPEPSEVAPAPDAAAFNFTVTALDPYGNTVAGYTGTVQFTTSDPAAQPPVVLPANYTFVTTDQGVHVFSATLATVGAQTLTITDTSATPAIAGTSNSITVSAGPTHFALAGPSNSMAGNAFNLTVTALDSSNDTLNGYTGTVHFTKSDIGAGSAVPSNYTFVAADKGVHVFSGGATLVIAGTSTITATDIGNSAVTGNAAFGVTPAAATSFTVTAPVSAAAGVAVSFITNAQDAFGNTAIGYTGTINFTSNDSQASLPADTTLSAGVGTFSVTLKTSGSLTLTATDMVTNSIAGTSNAITVTPAPAAKLMVVGLPAYDQSGRPYTFTVTAFDAFNNIATGYTGTVHFTSSDPSVSAGNGLPANYTFTLGNGGQHVFTNGATLVTVGFQTITATDMSNVSVTSNPTNVFVQYIQLIMQTTPGAPFLAGIPFNVTVTAIDNNFNTVTGYAGTIHFTSSDAQALLPNDSTLLNGSQVFSITLKTPAADALTATDTATSTITGSRVLTVTAGAATHFGVSVNAGAQANTPAGTSVNFTVAALDLFNNTATSYNGTVALLSSDWQTQPWLPPASALNNGLGVFSVLLRTAGPQILGVIDTANGLSGASDAVTVMCWFSLKWKKPRFELATEEKNIGHY